MSQQLPPFRTMKRFWTTFGYPNIIRFQTDGVVFNVDYRELTEKDPEQIVEMLNARLNAAQASSLGIVGEMIS